jgi:Tol biopolymer transport system component
MKLAWKRIWSSLALGVAAVLLSCSQQPSACEFAVTFDSTRDGSTEVYTLVLESLAVRQITDFPEPEIANRFPDWSPGGRDLVFVSENSNGVGDLFIVAADGTGLRKLTSDPARYENPAWSPGGEWIAFEKGKGEDWGLYLIRPDGSDLQQVEGHNLFHPSWSPDGKRLAVVTGDEPEYYGAILELRNGKPERFTPKGFNVGSVKWSPDGAAIAFDAVIGDNFDLYVADTDGSNLQRLTQSPAIDARPEWSPDGTKLLLNSTRDFGSVHGDERWDHLELYLLDLETGAVKRLTENDKFDAHPDWCKESG